MKQFGFYVYLKIERKLYNNGPGFMIVLPTSLLQGVKTFIKVLSIATNTKPFMYYSFPTSLGTMEQTCPGYRSCINEDLSVLLHLHSSGDGL